MAKQTINIGTSANDGTGSTLRAAFDITNDNFTELYDGTGGLLHKIEGTNFTGSLLVGHSTTGTLSSALDNTAVGINALSSITSGDYNTVVGKAAGGAITDAVQNTIIGATAGDALTSGSRNVAIGAFALSAEDGHGHNVAVGASALSVQNAGADAYNVAVGSQAGLNVTTGVRNTLIGGEAGDALTTGIYNVAIGYAALSTEDEHGFNTAIGYSALRSQNAGANGNNVAVGKDAGINVTTGINNTIIGALAGDDLTTGSNNTLIGKNATSSAVDVNNEITFGDSNITNVRIPSDSTLKIGVSGDLQIEHVSSNSFIKNTAVGDLYIENQVDDADIIFRSDDGSGGLETYLSLDGSDRVVRPGRSFVFPDNISANFGTGYDLNIKHDGSNSKLENNTGHLYINNEATDKDIIFQSDDGSGGLTTYFYLDGNLADGTYNYTRWNDGGVITFGGDQDLRIWHDPSNSSSYMRNYTNDLYIENTANDKDILFRCDDGSGGVTTYFKLDGSSASGGTVYTNWEDNSRITLGAGNDMQLYHDGSNNYVDITLGDLYFTNYADDKDIIFRSDDGSGGVTEYFRVDGSEVQISFSEDAVFADSKRLMFGAGGDLQMQHNGSNTLITNNTGNVLFTQNANDGDIVFYSDDGSGGVAEYFRLDGSATNGSSVTGATVFPDASKIYLGTDKDFEIFHNGSQAYIENYTGEMNFTQHVNDGDMLFKSDNGSGGTTEYFRVDGGNEHVVYSKPTIFSDNIALKFGDGIDLQIESDGANGKITNNVGSLYVINNADDEDIYFQNDDGSGGVETYFFLDGSLSGGNPVTIFPDNSILRFGSGGDLQLYHDGTSSSYAKITNGDLYIRNESNADQIYIQASNSSGTIANYLTIDGNLERNLFSKSLRLLDDVQLDIGSSDDFRIKHTSANNATFIQNFTGDLNIEQYADDKYITFKNDDGSGGTTEYFRVDGALGYMVASKHILLTDTTKLRVGSSADLEIYHDTSNSYIENQTNDLIIQNTANDRDIILKSDDGSGGVTNYLIIDGGEVATKILTQKVIMSNLPTSDPSNAGQLYTDSGVLKVSAG